MAEITIKEYFAVQGSRFSNKDAAIIGPALQEMQSEGGVTARDVLDRARSANSPLHPFFEWNNEVAADEYRLEQSRRMLRSIRVRYVDNGQTKHAPAFQSARVSAYEESPRAYRSFQVLHSDQAFAAQMMGSAYDDLRSWRSKYESYCPLWDKFGEVFQQIVNQIDEFEPEVVKNASASEMDKAAQELIEWRNKFHEGLEVWTAFHVNIKFILQAIKLAEDVWLEKSDVRERDCLKCGKPFKSLHAGNRICGDCYTVAGKSGSVLEGPEFIPASPDE